MEVKYNEKKNPHCSNVHECLMNDALSPYSTTDEPFTWSEMFEFTVASVSAYVRSPVLVDSTKPGVKCLD